MQASVIFTKTLEELRLGTRRIIHQGGQNSGKTVNILGALATCCAEEEDGKITTVTSMSMPHLKAGALRDFEMYVMDTFGGEIKQWNKTDKLATFKSGCMMEFRVFDTEMKARGVKRKRLFVNEANSFPKLLWFQLDSRSEQSIIDYNPSIRFWAHEDLIGEDGNKFYISDHRHNPFLTEEQHRFIENICRFKVDENSNILLNAKGEPLVERGDYELYKVYARGLTGNVTGIIFPHWQMIDESEMPIDIDWVYSIDFGYTVDPTAIIKQCKIGETLYIKELAYESGIPPKDIKQILIGEGFKGEDILYCEHDPDMIRILRNLGINATFARKGQGSVNAGIQLLNTYKIKYSNLSKNLKKELGLYIWEVDKVNGKLMNTPVDRNNHALDAVRYGAYTKFLRQQ